MQVLQNEHCDVFDAHFIRFEWNSLIPTPSFVCFTPISEVDKNQEFVVVVVVPIVYILMNTKLKSILIKA